LSGSEPLELLLEIGLEKLFKDYNFILSESQICSENVLKNLLYSTENKENENSIPSVRKSLHNAARQTQTMSNRKTLLHDAVKSTRTSQSDELLLFKNSYFDEKESLVQLAKLFQIHCVIEHILMMHVNLNLPNGNNFQNSCNIFHSFIQ